MGSDGVERPGKWATLGFRYYNLYRVTGERGVGVSLMWGEENIESRKLRGRNLFRLRPHPPRQTAGQYTVQTLPQTNKFEVTGLDYFYECCGARAAPKEQSRLRLLPTSVGIGKLNKSVNFNPFVTIVLLLVHDRWKAIESCLTVNFNSSLLERFTSHVT